MKSPRYDSHCYEILYCNHVTNTEKQEGTGVNLYQNEKHIMNWCHANTPQTKVQQLSRVFNNVLRYPGAVEP